MSVFMFTCLHVYMCSCVHSFPRGVCVVVWEKKRRTPPAARRRLRFDPPDVVFVCLFTDTRCSDVLMYLLSRMYIVPYTIPTYLTPYLKEVVLCVLGSSVVGRIHFGRLVLGLDVLNY